MTPNLVVTLEPSARNRRILDEKGSRSWFISGTTWIQCSRGDGTPLLMTLGYLKALALEGLTGLDAIPHACIDRRARRATEIRPFMRARRTDSPPQ